MQIRTLLARVMLDYEERKETANKNKMIFFSYFTGYHAYRRNRENLDNSCREGTSEPFQVGLISHSAECIQQILFFFYLVFTARQDYFTHFEPSQSIGGAKTEDPQEKSPEHPQAELGLSHM